MRTPFEQYDAITIVASIGGIQAIAEVLAALPADFPVPVLVVQHRSSGQPRTLAQVLQRWTALRVKTAEDGEKPRAGMVYIAPPDRHLTIAPNRTFDLHDGKRIKHLLSAGDPLFVSAAHEYGAGVIAIVLTGLHANGAAGVMAVKKAGGVVIAQDEATSEAFGMPKAAIATGSVDKILPLKEIGPELVTLARRGLAESAKSN